MTRTRIQLSDIDGTQRHGVDKRCQVEIVRAQGAPVVVSATARDWTSAFNQAMARAVATLTRMLARSTLEHHIGVRLPLDEIVRAHEMQERGEVTGNLVLKVG